MVEKFGDVDSTGCTWTCINNDILQIKDPDKWVSPLAAIIYCRLQSMPKGWNPDYRDLAKYFHVGWKTIRGAIRELERTGWLEPYFIRVKNGRFGKSSWLVRWKIPENVNDGENDEVEANSPVTVKGLTVVQPVTVKGSTVEALKNKDAEHLDKVWGEAETTEYKALSNDLEELAKQLGCSPTVDPLTVTRERVHLESTLVQKEKKEEIQLQEQAGEENQSVDEMFGAILGQLGSRVKV